MFFDFLGGCFHDICYVLPLGMIMSFDLTIQISFVLPTLSIDTLLIAGMQSFRHLVVMLEAARLILWDSE